MSVGLVDRTAPLFTAGLSVGGALGELLEAGAAVGVELRVLLIALLQEHVALFPIREGSIAGEIMLIDQGLDRFICLLRDGVFQAANKIRFRDMMAKLGESADQQIEFVEVGGHIGSVLMLQ